MAVTYSQLASLLRGGVPLLRSLEVLRKQSSNQTLNACWVKSATASSREVRWATPMARYPARVQRNGHQHGQGGGEGGFLEEALERVAQFTEQQEDLKSQTVGALAYPVFLACRLAVDCDRC